MNPVHPSRRRADAFAAAIEDPSTARADVRTAELLALVGSLREVAPPAARPAFVSDLRERLLLAAETELVPAERPQARPVVLAPSRSRRDRRVAVALGGLALVGATTSMAVAAQSALPGDVLYPVKRALEDADTGLSADDSKGPELLEHASSRLSELSALSRRTGDGEVDAITEQTIESTLDTFSEQAAQASDLLLAGYAETGDEDGVSALQVLHRRQPGPPGRPRGRPARRRPPRRPRGRAGAVRHRPGRGRRLPRAARASASPSSRRRCSRPTPWSTTPRRPSPPRSSPRPPSPCSRPPPASAARARTAGPPRPPPPTRPTPRRRPCPPCRAPARSPRAHDRAAAAERHADPPRRAHRCHRLERPGPRRPRHAARRPHRWPGRRDSPCPALPDLGTVVEGTVDGVNEPHRRSAPTR